MDESLETRRSVHPNLSDIEKLFFEAQHRWLSPAEICGILRNYKKLLIASVPPNEPSSGSLLLFDRGVTKHFRKDGHKWRKEGHKTLKIESVDVLNCYYARGEENENFRRRCYSILEKSDVDVEVGRLAMGKFIRDEFSDICMTLLLFKA